MTGIQNGNRQRHGVSELDDPPDRQGRRDGRLALVVASGFGVVVAFQVALVAGAPWGAAAYGGANHGPLPAELRAASIVVGFFWLLAGLTALSRGGLASPIPYSFSRRAMWGLTVVLAIGFVMNAASSSPWERFGWAPFILGLAVGCLRLSRSGRTDAGRSQP